MARAYVYDMVDTWDAGATTFTAIKMNVTDTASAAGSLLMDLQVGGASKFNVRKDGLTISSSAIRATDFNSTSASGQLTWNFDVVLTRDAANTLAQRNSTNAQTFRVYNTYTDASNYERGEVHWVSNVFRVGTYAAGTGTGRTLTFITSGVERWSVNASTGHFLAAADNTYDIGALGASRPRNLYLGGIGFAASEWQAPSIWATSALYVGSGADTVLRRDAADTLAQRNGTNAQTFRVYETYTDASNYARLAIDYNAGNWRITTAGAGTGDANRGILIGPNGQGSVQFQTNATSRWSIGATTGHFLASTDNTYDIGASGANRPRNLYMASWIRMATTTVAALPAAATAGAGARMFVTDALAPVFGSAVAGGGAVTVPVYSTGTAWNVG